MSTAADRMMSELAEEVAQRVLAKITPLLEQLRHDLEKGNHTSQPVVLTTRQAAAYCGISLQHLYNLLSTGAGPKRYKRGALNAFYPADLDEWLRSDLLVR